MENATMLARYLSSSLFMVRVDALGLKLAEEKSFASGAGCHIRVSGCPACSISNENGDVTATLYYWRDDSSPAAAVEIFVFDKQTDAEIGQTWLFPTPGSTLSKWYRLEKTDADFGSIGKIKLRVSCDQVSSDDDNCFAYDSKFVTTNFGSEWMR